MIDYPEGMPCWAPGSAEHLESLLKGDEVAWEWGGGASSAWLVDKVSCLHVMESDPKWARKIEDMVGEERKDFWLYLVPNISPDYIDTVELVKPRPNLWLIDGYMRIDCLELVERKTEHGDIVVLDDALDYAEHILRLPANGDVRRFAMPHPHAGIPINHAKYGHLGNTVREKHAATKETWIWRV